MKAIEWITNEKGCHLVTSHKKDKNGYIHIRRSINKHITDFHLHRYLYSKSHGEIPEGMVIMHTCDEPSCINMDHLILGTQKDNMDDKIKKGRSNYKPRGNSAMKAIIIPNKIKKLRIEKSYGFIEFTELIGLSISQLWRIENHKSNASLKTLSKIANGLNVSINDLLN
jgi:DNA-binding XRE family transcriptional regulator